MTDGGDTKVCCKELTWLQRLNDVLNSAIKDRNLYIKSLYYKYEFDEKEYNFNMETGEFVKREESNGKPS